MIEISHQQAQRLIRDGMDAAGNRVSPEQWATLQEHLSSCAECRAYARQFQTLERDVSHSLQGHWAKIPGPQRGVFRAVVDQRSATRLLRRRLRRALLVLAGVVGVVLFGWYWRDSHPEPDNEIRLPTLAAQVTPLPSPTPRGTYRGLIAFESAQEGNAEIYLLNAGPGGNDLANLTHNPAQDRAPQWSPDGEWLAFLSDRSGQDEIYVMHIAGSRLTRLTADPNLEWQAPLSWSVDGHYIAARALRRDQGGEAYLYLAPLDGSAGLRSVAYSRGVPGGGVFSPSFTNLAFQSGVLPGRLMVYGLSSGWYSISNYRDANENKLHATGAFDWSVGGSSLFYLAEGPYEGDQAPQLATGGRSELHLSPIQDESTVTALLETRPWTITSQPGLGVLRSPAWMPESLVSLAAQDADGDGCWTLNLYPNSPSGGQAVELSGLCLEGGLNQQSWQRISMDETWMIVRGRRPNETRAGFYAVRLPSVFSGELPKAITAPIEGVGAPGFAFADDPAAWPSEPKVRPSRARLHILPVAATAPPAALPTLGPSAALGGRLVAASFGMQGSALLGLAADGSGPRELVGAQKTPGCPSLSPDGAHLAYLAANNAAAGNEVWVSDLPSGSSRKLAGLTELPASEFGAGNAPSMYGCPVWAPDSTQLAAEYRAGGLAYLALIPLADGQPGFLRIEGLPVPPQWTARDGQNGPLLMVYARRMSNPLRVVSLDPQDPLNQAALAEHGLANTVDLAALTEPDTAGAFAAAPDGSHFALIAYNYDSSLRLVSRARLVAGDMHDLASLPLDAYDPNRAGPRSLAFLADGRVGVLLPLPQNGSVKTLVGRFDPSLGTLETVASLTDLSSEAAWTPTGDWVFLASESGLWVLNVDGALAGGVAPKRLLADWVTSVAYSAEPHD